VTDSSEQNGEDDLDRRIAEAQAKHQRGISRAEGSAETRGWAVGIEFVGSVLVMGLAGWALDNWAGLGTRPWGMIVGVVLGFVVGTYSAMKASRQFDTDPGNDE
jgi:ATP synthase protein I